MKKVNRNSRLGGNGFTLRKSITCEIENEENSSFVLRTDSKLQKSRWGSLNKRGFQLQRSARDQVLIQDLSNALKEKDIDLADKDAVLSNLKALITIKDKKIEELVGLCEERLKVIENQAAHLANNNEVLDQKNAYIEEIARLCDERLQTITGYEESIARANTLVDEKSREINLIRQSRLWRHTAKLRRSVGKVKSVIVQKSKCRLTPLRGVEPIPKEQNSKYLWRSLDQDPQFILKPFQNSILKQKELTLSFHLETNSEATFLQIYFDVGYGFNATMRLDYSLKDGRQMLALPMPKWCRGIRLDPVSEECKFSIANVSLHRRLKEGVIEPDNGDEAFNYIKNFGRHILPHKPVNDLESFSAGCWVSTDKDPHFDLDVSQVNKGWYLLTAQYTGENTPYFHSKLYVDYGEGVSEELSKTLHLKSGKLKKRVVYFREKPRGLRLDPLDTEGVFSVDRFSLKSLPAFYAHKLIKKKLARQNIGVKGDLSKDYDSYNEKMTSGESTTDYPLWIQLKETPLFSDIENINNEIDGLAVKPLISVVMPTYNTDLGLLRKCIESVLNQYYKNLELCIADDCSPNNGVRLVLEEYAKNDPRVKLVFRTENGHISRATNSALSVASGELIALLDHDDELAPFALSEIAKAYNKNDGLNIIYSDEDKIDGFGNRFSPHFKPAWNPDLLYSQNYISHLGVYRRSVLEAIGGFRVGVEGSQDYDLLLRAVKHVKGNGIHHIPHVLYHWRAIEGSTALAAGEKDYTSKAGVKALENFFSDVSGVEVKKGRIPNTYNVIWPLPIEEPLVSLIIPTYNGYEITKQAIDSILDKSTYRNFEILLVDNNSDSKDALNYFLEIEKHDKVRVLRYPYPFNYSAINNFAASQAKGSILGLINNDIEVISPGWLTNMVRHVLRPDVGCVGAKLYYPNDTVQHAGVIMGMGGVAGHGHKHYPRVSPGYFGRLFVVQNFTAVTAAALLVRKSVFSEVGGLNEKELKVAFNDVDFCLRVKKAGYRNLWTPYAELYHHESISRGAEDNPEKVARFNSEVEYMEIHWRDELDDEFYSPNLTLKRDDFSIGL